MEIVERMCRCGLCVVAAPYEGEAVFVRFVIVNYQYSRCYFTPLPFIKFEQTYVLSGQGYLTAFLPSYSYVLAEKVRLAQQLRKKTIVPQLTERYCSDLGHQ